MLYFEDINLNEKQYSREYLIGQEEIIEFASQWDPQPFHVDLEEAKKWPMGLIASSVHSYAISIKLSREMLSEPPAAVAGLGTDEMRMLEPVRPGDRLRLCGYIESKRESVSKPDMGIITAVNELLNQNNQIVLSYKTSSLILKKPSA